jgi:hypothetical protein
VQEPAAVELGRRSEPHAAAAAARDAARRDEERSLAIWIRGFMQN